MASDLTPRELETVQLAADGLNRLQIAETMEIAVGTLDKIRERVMQKLGADNVTHAVAMALRRSLVK